MIVTGVGVHGQPSRLELRAFTGLAMAFAVVLVGNNVLIPNLNSAAMVPVGHVAGTAAAVFASVTTAAGAVMGARLDHAFDGTVNPFSLAFGIAGVAALVMVLAVRDAQPAPDRLS